MRTLLWLCLASICLAVNSARAQDSSDERMSPKEVLQSDCFDDDMNNRCDAESRRQTRARFGVPSIEELNESGAQVRRAFFVDGYGSEMPVITFIRAPGAGPRVTVSIVRESANGSRRVVELTEELSAPVWDDAIARTELFHRALAPQTMPVTDDEEAAITICLHSWVTTVEAADPPGSLRMRTQDSCNEGLTTEAGFYLARLAYEALPYCTALELNDYRNRVAALQACALLEGDRLAAAEALNRIDAMDDARLLVPVANSFLQHNITIEWGAERANGAAAAAALWDAKDQQRRHLYHTSVIGESANRVRVTGIVYESYEEGARHAEVEQIWTREHAWRFRLSSMRVSRLRR